MLEIKNIIKRYKIKKNNEFTAIDNISLSFSQSGFVFIVGKSGSGKSTLLNLIGGLDSYDEGDISINNTSLTNLKEKEIDAYRNTYLGFVFQDFNLIEEYNVYENVCLSLDLINYQGNKEDKVLEVLEKVELLDKRYNKINELSGGQKQRVAIARALVKDPQIILADEPTGNLDSKTSEVIMDLLKRLSKDKLIIMVSHDTELPSKYGSRVIELKDGSIIKDTNEEKINNEELDFKLINAKFLFKNIFKMSIDSIKNRKIKICMTLLLLMSSIFMYAFSQTIINFDYGKATETTINMDDNRVFKMSNGNNDFNIQVPENFSEEEINDLENKYTNTKFNKSYSTIGIFDFSQANSYEANIYSTSSINRVIEVDELSDLGLNLKIGEDIKENNEIIISEYIAEYVVSQDSSISSINDLLEEEFIGTNLKVSGIYESNHLKYEPLKDFNNTKEEDFPMELYIEWNQYKHLLQSIVIKDGQYKELIHNSDLMKISRSHQDETFSEFIRINNSNSYDLGISNIHIGLSKYTEYIDDVNYVVGSSFSLGGLRPNQVLININMMNDFFGLSNDPNIVDYNYLVDNNIIGKEIPIELLYGKGSNQSTKVSNDMEIVGVFKPDNLSIHKNSVVMIERYDYLEYKSQDIELFVHPDSNSSNFFNYATEQNYIIHSPKISVIKDITSGYEEVSDLLFYASIAIGTFGTMLFFNNISGSILDKKKQIGTLRAIGTRGLDVVKVFIIEGLIIGLVSYILGMIALLIFTGQMNNEVYNIVGYKMNIFSVSLSVSLSVFTLTMAMSFLSSFIPCFKIIRMNIIDAIDRR